MKTKKKSLHSNLVKALANKKVFAHRFCAQTFCPSYNGRGVACHNFAYYSILIILSWRPKGGAMAQCPPPKYAPGSFVRSIVYKRLNYLLDLFQRWQQIRIGFRSCCFFSGIRIGSESSFIRRCGSGSEFGFALPNNLGTKSALHSAKTFLSFGLHLNFGRENAPIFSEDFFIFIFLVFT